MVFEVGVYKLVSLSDLVLLGLCVVFYWHHVIEYTAALRAVIHKPLHLFFFACVTALIGSLCMTWDALAVKYIVVSFVLWMTNALFLQFQECFTVLHLHVFSMMLRVSRVADYRASHCVMRTCFLWLGKDLGLGGRHVVCRLFGGEWQQIDRGFLLLRLWIDLSSVFIGWVGGWVVSLLDLYMGPAVAQCQLRGCDRIILCVIHQVSLWLLVWS